MMISRQVAQARSCSHDAFVDLIAGMDPISLASLDQVKLLDRVDTKFVMRDWQLLQVLRRIRNDYFVLAATDDRVNRYRTLYFDTEDLALYTQHHNDQRHRHKVRCRHYVDSGLSFVEVKFKTGRNRTIKNRLQTAQVTETLRDRAGNFVAAHCPLSVEQLRPSIWNAFSRITLVSKHRRERLTLDIDYRHSWQQIERGLPAIAIAEVKQQKLSFDSEFLQQLRMFHIRSTGFSKYCTGIADIYPQVKYNRFKRRFLMLERLSQLDENL